jgi:hypothetical protein
MIEGQGAASGNLTCLKRWGVLFAHLAKTIAAICINSLTLSGIYPQ